MRYNKKIQWTLLLMLIIATQVSLLGCDHKKTKGSMNDLEYKPKVVNDVKINTITINTPRRIICNTSDTCMKPAIPLYVVYAISLRRAYKYMNLSDRMIHVKCVDNATEYSGKIIEETEDYCIPLPTSAGLLEAANEAQRYTDAELDKGQYENGCMDVNITDYVDFPLLPGKYEIWLSWYGLESNHTIFSW